MKSFSYSPPKAKSISRKDTFCLIGRTISATTTPWLMNFLLKRARHRLLKRLRATEFPYCLDTINPKVGWEVYVYLNDKSPTNRGLEIFIIWLNSAEGMEKFNYAEISLRPLLRRLAKIDRPLFVPILFLNPCLFLRLRLVYLTVTFIKTLFP